MSVLLASLAALAAEPHTIETLRPYLNNEVNGLELNHWTLQSMLANDVSPTTVGWSVRAAPAEYLRTDGQVSEAGLSKILFVGAVGVGKPSDGAFFAGINASTVRPSGYPDIWAFDAPDRQRISAYGRSIVLYAGGAANKTAVEVAYHRIEQLWDGDSLGAFQPGGCGSQSPCTYARDTRVGSPYGKVGRTVVGRGAWLFNVENREGYHGAVLISPVRSREQGVAKVRQTLSAFRGMGQPTSLENKVARFGAGLDFFAEGVDYYGDLAEGVARAAKNDAPLPDTEDGGLYQLPLVADGIGGTGARARLIPQVLPTPALRMVELGYNLQGDGKVRPQAGARGKLFRRGDAYVPAADAFVGLLITGEEEERGLAMNVSYSQNSPDSLTFLPLPDAQVLGFQLVWGNPYALPPPVPAAQVAE